MNIEMKYGEGRVRIDIPERWNERMTVVKPGNDTGNNRTQSSEEAIILGALNHPVECPPLEALVHPGETVVIVTSDMTRPMPTHKVIPHVIKKLIGAGIVPEDITVVFALGIHRNQTASEHQKLLGIPPDTGIRVEDSDPYNVIQVGHTASGTPVNVTRTVTSADRIVCLGNVEYHYFAGYSGGYKAILPGVCDRETVSHNHKMITDTNARAGIIEGNPIREDIDSVADVFPVDFIVNVVLDSSHGIEFCAAGHPLFAHRTAVDYLNSVGQFEIQRRAPLVIAGTGGSPKDLNLYQAQKALEFSLVFAQPGAPIILVASCPEGYGNETMARWFAESGSPEGMVQRLENEFELGGHKAAMIARAVARNPVWIVTEMPTREVSGAFMKPLRPRDGRITLPKDLIEQIDRSGQVEDPIYVLPNAASTFARARD